MSVLFPDSWSSRFASLFTFYGIALAALNILAAAVWWSAPSRPPVSVPLLVLAVVLMLACLLAGWILRRKARRGEWPT